MVLVVRRKLQVGWDVIRSAGPANLITTIRQMTIFNQIKQLNIGSQVKYIFIKGIQEYWSIVEIVVWKTVWKQFTSNVLNICRITG